MIVTAFLCIRASASWFVARSRLKNELAALFEGNVSVSDEHWGDMANESFTVEIHGISEAEIRELAKRLRGE